MGTDMSDANNMSLSGSDELSTAGGDGTGPVDARTQELSIQTIVSLSKRVVGPAETLIRLGNERFIEANAAWELSEALRREREMKPVSSPSESRKKKSTSKQSDTPTQGTDPTAPDLLERERTSSARAERGFAEAERLYIRASHLIPDNGVDGVNAELWPVVRLNLGECCLRRGSDAEAQEYIAPVVAMLDSPRGPTGAMVVAAQDLLLETARVWWKGLVPDDKSTGSKTKKKGKSKSKGKVKGKSKGKKKSKKKSKK